MKSTVLKNNQDAFSIFTFLSILLVVGVGVALYLGITAFVESGGFGPFFEDLGTGAANALTGFASGSITGLFNFGKKLGEATNPFD